MVLAIMAVLAVVMTPAFDAFTNAGALNKASADISNTLEYARAYAVGNSTYVYVGFQEVDGLTPGNSSGVGRVVVAVIASGDGMRPYTSLSGVPDITTDTVAVTKIQAFNNIHLAAAATLQNGAMSTRPAADVDLSGDVSTTTFQWPLPGPAQNTFTKVIEFDSQGVARVQTGNAYRSSISGYIEIPLVTAHGNQVAATTSQIGNQAAIQVDGITGAVHIYRP